MAFNKYATNGEFKVFGLLFIVTYNAKQHSGFLCVLCVKPLKNTT